MLMFFFLLPVARLLLMIAAKLLIRHY